MKNNSLKKTNSNTEFHRAGRWSDEPKREHLIVLQALEIANRAFTRVVTVNEVIQALSSKEIDILNEKYNTPMTLCVSKILLLLCKRGKVFKTDKVGKVHYYGVIGLLDVEYVNLDKFQSLRSKTLKLVQEAVLEKKMALQMGELLEFIKCRKDLSNINPKLITQSILSLKQTGELIKIPMRGNEKGFGVYLPNNLDPDFYLPKQPVTWLEFVLSVFNEIWNEHKLKAEKDKSKPFPVSIGEIRARVAESKKFPQKLEDSQVLISTLLQLAKTSSPSLRKIRKPNQKLVFWVSLDVTDNEVNIGDFYLRDADRLEEAVKRATFRYQRPVKFSEAEEEIDFDPYLQPISTVSYSKLLADLAKERSYENKARPKFDRKRVYRIGKFQGNSYYHFENTPEISAFIKFRCLERKWNLLNPLEELLKFESCTLPTVAIGRAKIIIAEITSILKDLEEVQSLNQIIGISEYEIKSLSKEILKIKLQTQTWIKKSQIPFPNLPSNVETTPKGWTKHKLKEALTPFYHRLSKINSDNYFQSLIGEIIKRFPNPQFKRTNVKEPLFAAEYLYDESDALIYIAKEWGGVELRYHATIASNELGMLRDFRFVIPALESKDFNQRLYAASCLAFLPCEEGSKKLLESAVNDVDAGVRQSSLWAYGFINAEKAIPFIKEQSFKDENPKVRKFAKFLIENFDNVRIKFQ